ncbi:protein MTSS 2-like isoform X1 [Rhopilema esculentum]|uniref:protein MTSS 2-like isoform X1 n=1 Tax=Rhopilema esculentum TaxID=499914 RepID=UPI0031D9F156
MGDSSDGESGCLFNAIIGDMKTMMPLWEDFLVKASKFYNAVKSSAYAADTFLDSFQKLADATTASKGSTRDIGVSFTKLVMRHKSIEHKLKAYIGILTDSFIGPMQEKLEEWKKTSNQLEKDHTKDFKRAKSDAKKSVGEVMKLRKKVIKKDDLSSGRTEYHGQYTDAWKLANIQIAALEDQERQYLRKLMIEERSRAIFFFNCYRPVVELELTLIGEIENLQTILEDTTKQCTSPSKLPLAAEDAINNYKAPERISLPKTEVSSPPPSPTLESARQRAFTSIPKGNQNIQRSNTVSGSSSSGYSTLRKKGSGGPAPKPVGIPHPVKSPSKSADGTFEGDSHESLHSSSGTVSNYSSMSSLSTASGDHIAPDQNPATQNPAAYGDEMREQVAYYTQHDAKAVLSGAGGMANVSTSNPATRTSWSSLETSDSSGVGSYISLNSQGRPQHGYDKNNGYNSDGQYEETDGHPVYDFDDDINVQMANLNHGSVQMSQNFQQQCQNFRRNTDFSSSMRGTRSSGAPYRRSNSITEGESPMVDYKMTLPSRRSNTVYAKNAPTGAKPTVFQLYGAGQTPSQLRSRLSPTGSPVKAVAPPNRKISSPPNLMSGGMISRQQSAPYVKPSMSPESSFDIAPSTAGLQGMVGKSAPAYPVSTTAGSEYASRHMAMSGNEGVHYAYSSQSNDYAVPSITNSQPQARNQEDFPPPPPPLQLQETNQYQLHMQQQQQNQHYHAPQQHHRSASGGQAAMHQQNYPASQLAQMHQQLQQQQQQRQQQYQQYQGHQPLPQHQQLHKNQTQYSGAQQQQQAHYSYQQQTSQYQSFEQGPLSYSRRDSHSADDDMPVASPGSFLDELQQKRTIVRSRTMSAGSSRP